jgi:hypothetical protein
MAHNNGMIPRKGGRSANAKKFQKAVDAVPIAAAGTAYDPAAPETGGFSDVGPIGALPLYGATGAEIAGFVPHRPQRPQKSEGGIRFTLVSE